MSREPAARRDRIAAAEEWEAFAAMKERAAAWDREIGIHGLGVHPDEHLAASCRLTARAFGMEAATGEPHCAEHDPPRPRTSCPHGGRVMR